MRKIKCAFLLLSLILFYGCPLGEGDFSLSGDSQDSSDTAISSEIGNYPLLSPSNLKVVGTSSYGVFGFYLVWNSVSYANGYNVYSSDSQEGEFTLVKLANSCEFMMDVDLAGAESLTRFFKVKAVNVNGKESAFSAVATAEITTSGTFNKHVQSVVVTKGTVRGIQVKWPPVPEAFSYQIWRAVYGTPFASADLVKPVYVPINNGDPNLLWDDLSVKHAVLYDYWIVCFTENGVEGNVSSVGSGGFTRPYVEFLFGNQGSVRETTGVDYSYIELMWEIAWCQEDSTGLMKNEDGTYATDFVTPEEWFVGVTLTPSSNVYSSVGGGSGALTYLLTVVDDSRKAGLAVDSLDVDLHTNSDQWTVDGAFFKRVRYHEGIPTNVMEYLYRVKVIDTAAWGGASGVYIPYYFSVESRYNVGSTQYEYISPPSSMQLAYAISPANTAVAPSNFQLTGIGGGFASFSWDSVGDASSYKLYRKKSTDYKFELVSPDGHTEVIYTETSVSASGDVWYYAVSSVNGTGESQLSFPVAVTFTN